MSNEPIIKPRGLSAATRLEMNASEIPPSDRRRIVVDELQELVNQVNRLLERRDGLFMTPKKLREKRFSELSEDYAELMVSIEGRHKELGELEESMKIPDLSE